MSDDLVTRLREKRCVSAHGLGTAFSDPLTDEAADEIERLRAEVAALTLPYKEEKDRG